MVPTGDGDHRVRRVRLYDGHRGDSAEAVQRYETYTHNDSLVEKTIKKKASKPWLGRNITSRILIGKYDA